MAAWEVKKDGITVCSGESMAGCPSYDLIKSMSAAGYKIYIDGKLQKVRQRG